MRAHKVSNNINQYHITQRDIGLFCIRQMSLSPSAFSIPMACYVALPQSGLEAKILASASKLWPQPGLDLIVLLYNRVFFVQKSCKNLEFC